MERFWSKVDKGGECWLWTAARTGNGYGAFWSGERLVCAHRFAWELLIGPIPAGLVLDHVVCDTPLCVRPEHMQVTTSGENVRRSRLAQGEAARAARTHCANGHPYAETEVPMTSTSPQRRCRICRNETQRRYNARRKLTERHPVLPKF